jgi:hypothetical protein
VVEHLLSMCEALSLNLSMDAPRDQKGFWQYIISSLGLDLELAVQPPIANKKVNISYPSQ